MRSRFYVEFLARQPVPCHDKGMQCHGMISCHLGHLKVSRQEYVRHVIIHAIHNSRFMIFGPRFDFPMIFWEKNE